ncbi:HlyD family efflux transporter periplasmic adaptor subunit [Pedobacter sp. G11]|uniref:HlyD family efflux transporter periplasmic adaptor subunit n=1 Tax=Pedobacter sp. G11 TaxID=2482728 RepID=UPI000F5EB466|nr:HlyD family efflux transporter periplasmic adaptor subunit [Pedobacter sp. G11]AZI24107.1 HlyD family efflux transporter periplasmic adaptor subunit [Pedobacter sp. G11]
MENKSPCRKDAFQQLHNDELNEIITAVPRWILRWGISLVFSLLIMILTGAALIDYPEVITSNLKIKSIIPVHQVAIANGGIVTGIVAKNGELVRKGQILCFLETGARHEDILVVFSTIEAIRQEAKAGSIRTHLPVNLKLGELKDAYEKLYNSFSVWYHDKRQIPKTKLKKAAYFHSIRALNDFSKNLEWYLKTYTIRAPIHGILNYSSVFSQNQMIKPGEKFLTVSGLDHVFFGEISIAQENRAKIKIGQKVLIKLKSYPFQQFGILQGEISNLSDVLYKDSIYLGRVSLQPFEQKNANKKLMLNSGMRADVEVITENNSLLQRIFRNLTRQMTRI